mgnify:CR=1 FL=1
MAIALIAWRQLFTTGLAHIAEESDLFWIRNLTLIKISQAGVSGRLSC